MAPPSSAGYDLYLRHALSKYKNADLTKRDVLSAVQQYRGLFPKMDTYVFNDGTQRELLSLDGTVPVSYKTNTYNIPVCIWLLDTHPYNAPMCFVKPTNDMHIKVSRHVDQTGKIYLPYLHEWKHNTSDLLGLIQVMIIVFGEQPPVYSKPKHSESSQSSAHGGYSNPAAPPPYPTAASGMPMPGGAPVPPAYGSAMYQPPPPYAPAGGASNYFYPTPYPPVPNYPYPPTSTGPAPQPPGYTPPYSTAAPAYSSTNPPYPPYPQQVAAQPTPPPVPPPPITSATATGSTNTITEEHIKASLLSAVEDKMKRKLQEVLAQSQAEMDVLKRTQDDLNKGRTRLDDIINKLEQEQLDLDKNVEVLKEKNEQMIELIQKMEQQDEIQVDEAVVTVAPLYKQLLNAFAEENAMEDAIYYLSEGLRRHVIDLDVFLKHVRELSRRQFMLRALIMKCREKANLPI